MQMAQIIGGYSLGGADLLRRAMGKKKAEEMAQHRQIFREGAAKNGLAEKQADDIFDLMEKFAGYGFNKSHAAAYALLAYYTAWLKAHHPAEFMAANMSLAMDDTDKVKVLYEDATGKANGLSILPPDINRSSYRFEPTDASTIRYGLGAIKGSGQSAIEDIIRARADKPFTDLFDFCQRIDRRTVNRRTIEALVRAGAFDSLYGGKDANRAQLLANINLALETAEQFAAEANQVSLFSLFDDVTNQAEHQPELVSEPAWSSKRLLQEEKLALGFYLSGHLFDAYREEVRRFAKTPLSQLTEGRDKLLAGVITSLRTQMTQRGKMLIVLLDDGTAQLEISIYNELFDANRAMFQEDELLVVKGNVRNDSFTGGLRVAADAAWDMRGARTRFGQALAIHLDSAASSDGVRDWLSPYIALASGTDIVPGEAGLPIRFYVSLPEADCQLRAAEQYRCSPADELLQTVQPGIQRLAVEY